jgi:hypothetical protein
VLKLLLVKSTGSLLGPTNKLKTGEKLGISLSFALSHSLLQLPWNQGRTGMIDNIFMTRDGSNPKEQRSPAGQILPK